MVHSGDLLWTTDMINDMVDEILNTGEQKMTKFDEELGMADFVLFEDEDYRIVFHFFG